MKMTPAIKRIRKTRGLARKIALGIGVSAQAVGHWRRVPAERVIDVERITAIPRGELRPDLYPQE